MTPAEQARDLVSQWFDEYEDSSDAGYSVCAADTIDPLITRLTPVFERAQDAEGSREFAWKAIERVVAYEDVIVALREWAERAEADVAARARVIALQDEEISKHCDRANAAEVDVARLRAAITTFLADGHFAGVSRLGSSLAPLSDALLPTPPHPGTEPTE